MTDGDITQRPPLLHRCMSGSTALVGLLGLLILLAARPGYAQLFEDAAAIIPPEETLSEEQNDHVEAVALFAHGRVLLQRSLTLDGTQRSELLAAALRRFQRAWWFDHDLVSILEDIAPLTFELERQFEATRYLIIAAGQESFPSICLPALRRS